jgi:hypothetical protein
MCSSVALVIVALFFVVSADPYYFPDWKQCYYAWKNYPIGKSNETLCSKGDTTTSLVIWMASHGFEGNPRTLNTWLNNNNGYQGSNILWSRAADAWTMSYIGVIALMTLGMKSPVLALTMGWGFLLKLMVVTVHSMLFSPLATVFMECTPSVIQLAVMIKQAPSMHTM